ncbi:MAG: helix-turn-helix transcriptional regulator [Clostridia bacterium]|nr:helix-turn-helix transcriptional regulator [Clostridia bacterium]
MKDNFLGKKLREFRIEKGISQRRFGELFNVSNQTVSTWETGVHDPDLDTLIAIAKYYEVSVGYLLGSED